MESRHHSCFVCGSDSLRELGRYYEHHQLVKCNSCGFVFNQKIPTNEELNEHYSQYSYGSEGYLSPITIKSYNLLLDEFERYRNSNRILDIGCGRGWFLQEARKRGWEVFGTEYSDKAVEICEKSGVKMKQGKLDASEFDNHDFDVITSFEVIEHINNPNEDLKEINKLLRKGGLFYCTTPNFDSLMRYYLKEQYNVIDYPEHLSYYTKRTLKKVVEQNGFEMVNFLSTGISLTRIRKSKNQSDEKYVSENSADEQLRRNIESKWYLQFAKDAANGIMTLTNTGLSLKGYFVKQ